MKYHIALGCSTNLESIAKDALEKKCPRHAMEMLANLLQATVHQPILSEKPSYLDNLRSQLISNPNQWQLARFLSSKLTEEDIIFCSGEDIGIPIATLCGAKNLRPKIAVFIHNIDRPRGRLAAKLFNLKNKIDLFIACSSYQTNFLHNHLNIPKERIRFLWHQIDLKFFTPGNVSSTKKRPIIASVGLEKRDYKILAEATQDLDVDVKISGFSQDAAVLAKTFPQVMPANMSRQFYQWNDLVQLYRDADVVVVSLQDNSYAAGVQALMEGMACRKPVIVTKTRGIADYISDTEAVVSTELGNISQLRQAIVDLLNNARESKTRAQKAYRIALEKYDSDYYIENLARQLQTLQS